MLLLLLKQCLQEQARHVYGTTLWLPNIQTLQCQCSALHQDLPRVSSERGSSNTHTPGWESCLPSLRHPGISHGKATQRKQNPVRRCFSLGSTQEFRLLAAVAGSAAQFQMSASPAAGWARAAAGTEQALLLPYISVCPI